MDNMVSAGMLIGNKYVKPKGIFKVNPWKKEGK
jgi:hypothetical protein